MAAIPVIVPRMSPRLQYVLDTLVCDQLDLDYYIAAQDAVFPPGTFVIAYGVKLPGAFSIPDAGLLWETDVHPLNVAQGTWQDLPTFFAAGENHTLPFDIFSAVFFLLSRYEEYLPYTPDRHGRYPATESILYKTGLLQRPIIDEWTQQLRDMLRNEYQLPVKDPEFRFLPTYDIDIAWSYKHKGRQRTAGSIIKKLLGMKTAEISEQMRVLQEIEPDPYDAYDRIEQLHAGKIPKPKFFVLAAHRTTPFDKNISPKHPAMSSLIRRLMNIGEVGMHPSYYSNDENIFAEEQHFLQICIQKEELRITRQHYIKLKLPDTYHLLDRMDMYADYSMGYATHPGFRAGTAQSFYWYDLSRNKEGLLEVFPFCFMDTMAHYFLQLDVDKAFSLLREMTQRLKACNSILITVFHNFSLGTDKEWAGWYEAYERFVQEIM